MLNNVFKPHSPYLRGTVESGPDVDKGREGWYRMFKAVDGQNKTVSCFYSNGFRL